MKSRKSEIFRNLKISKKSSSKNDMSKWPIPAWLFIGLTVLFFFPEPETNFFAYIGTALFFILLIMFLIIKKRRYLLNFS